MGESTFTEEGEIKQGVMVLALGFTNALGFEAV